MIWLDRGSIQLAGRISRGDSKSFLESELGRRLDQRQLLGRAFEGLCRGDAKVDAGVFMGPVHSSCGSRSVPGETNCLTNFCE